MFTRGTYGQLLKMANGMCSRITGVTPMRGRDVPANPDSFVCDQVIKEIRVIGKDGAIPFGLR